MPQSGFSDVCGLDTHGAQNSVSVAMATYNGEKFLRPQLASIAAQTRLPAELVVTDDASTDATVDILDEFAATAPFPVHIHRNPSRLGYRANFMRVMALCRSDIVALSDQDDIWEPEKLEVAIQSFADPDVVLFFHNACLIDSAGNVTGPATNFSLPPRSAPMSFYPMVNPFGFSMVFRRQLTCFADQWPLSLCNLELTYRMAHDTWIFFLASVLGTVVYSDAQLARYRQHGNNTYGWKRPADVWHRRIVAMMQDNGGVLVRLAAAAAARARVLRSILQSVEAQSLSPHQRDRVAASLTYYDGLSLRLDLRSQIYMAPRAHRRVSASIQLLRKGGYARDNLWNIGPKAFWKDVVLGLVFRPLLVRQTDSEALAAEHLRRDLKTE